MAEEVMQELVVAALGGPKRVADPGTRARDAEILAQGGFAIESVTPVDQFVFSAHVEIVAVLRRAVRASRGRR
jgi:23S rRNA (uracil1939-C5)-methyltransferase